MAVMLGYKGYKDYSVIVFKEEGYIGKFYAVTNLRLLTIWLFFHPTYWGWTSMRVSHRVSNKMIQDYKRSEHIPSKPKPDLTR